MEFNDFDWDQKIINDIFLDITYEIKNKSPQTQNKNENIPITKAIEAPIKEIENVSEPIQYFEYTNQTNPYTNQTNPYTNQTNNSLNQDEDSVFGIKFPYNKKFYVILCFFLLIILVYMYSMISRYDSLLLLVLNNMKK